MVALFVPVLAALCLLVIAAGLAARARAARSALGPAEPSAEALQRWPALARATLSPDRGPAVLLVLLLLLDAGLALVAPWPVTIVIDQVLGHRRLPAVLTPLAHLATPVAVLCVAAGGLLVLALGAVVGYLAGYLGTVLAERTGARLRKAAVAHLLRVPPASLDAHPAGELASRVGGDTARVGDAVVSMVETLVPELGLLAGMAVVTGLLDWRLMLTALAVVPLFAGTARLRNRSAAPAARLARQRAGELAAHLTGLLSRLPAVHVFGQARRELRDFDRLNARSTRAAIGAVDAGARFTPVTDTLPGLALAAALVAGALEVRSGRLTLGGLVLFLAYLSGLTAPMRALAGLSGTLARGRASRARLAEVLAVAPLAVRAAAPRAGGSAAAPRAGCGDAPAAGTPIRFADVRLWRSGLRGALGGGLSLDVRAGEFVCLTGPSGSGKSSVLSLLCRLAEPDAGVIALGGRDLATVPLDELRQLVTLVPQQPWLHAGTIADNIAYGCPAATPARIRAAAERAGAAEFVERLPHGYATPLGEHGGGLSGGEQRRVALARALLLDTPVLLLDEPTAGLDGPVREHVVAMLRSLRDRTVVAATHDAALAAAADRIVELSGAGGPRRVPARRPEPAR